MSRFYQSLEPLKPPTKPSSNEKPELADYDLTEERWKWLNRRRKKMGKIVGWGMIIIVNAFILLLIVESRDVVIYLLLYVFGIGPISAITYGITYILIEISFKSELKQLNAYNSKLENYNALLRKYESWMNKTDENFWRSLSGRVFEIEMAELFRNMGYLAELSAQGGDGGIDIILRKDKEEIIVQCKAHKKAIGPSVARDLYGTMHHHGATSAILACTGGFTKGVHEYVDRWSGFLGQETGIYKWEVALC
jgi:hypothetical protein